MRKAKYERRGRVIKDLETDQANVYRYINEAKRASRRLQGHALGQGLLRVIK